MARFLVRMNASKGNALAATGGPTADIGFTLTPLMPHSSKLGTGFGLGQSEDWFLATTEGEVDPGDAWDECHARTNAFGAAAGTVTYAEPDILQPFVTDDGGLSQAIALDGASVPASEEYWMADANIPHGANFDWHLEDAYSGLRSARNSIQTPPDQWRVRVGHLDTGYTNGHQLLPVRLDHQLQRSFVPGDNAQSAIDPFKTGFMKNPGHGTGTLCLLAGGSLSSLCFTDENRADGDFLGGAPHARVIPVRIAPSVVLMYTSGFAQGLDYLLAPNGDPSQSVDVVSMSMGGVCSAAWTDIVNRAYDAGVVLCTAAGNHFGDLPPTSIIYPARYRRVVAVCGVMQDGRPYADLPLKIMCGCYGPQSKMSTAMAAYSPNLPWALFNNLKGFRWDGEGTSAATPQVAAAAALYIEAHYNELKKLPGWARVEAVRNALFTAAARKSGGEIDARLGNGVLAAAAALGVPVSASTRQQEKPDSASFPFLRVLTGIGLAQQTTTADMLNVEIVQLTQQYADLQKMLPDPEAINPNDPQDIKRINDFLSAITTIPGASRHLKAALSNRLKTGRAPIRAASRWTPPPAQYRKLQGYVFDPSMSTQLQYVNLSETIYKIRWEPNLKPGPIGEYLEVVDTEAPLDLNAHHILAQNGLEPTETSPQFRQQMLYAVGMQTIDVFESALGRLINWAPDEVPGTNGKPKKVFRRRLNLYPHGIQAPNAFYSPPDRAIYFGYFKATDLTGTVYPGMVYAALSHDIIAHEMTHAVLDGIHKAFREPSNPDVLAFHEAFADIIALLQQFGNIDIVRSQSAAVRGDLSMESLLGNLARQFGEATKGRSALRSAYLAFNEHGVATPIEPDPNKLTTATEAHDRGAILVAAVYGAFLSIYRNRTLDLYRIASDGKSETALHLLAPDLVNRLALEASRAARHVLKMCIRAIDYLPPVDITFGDFLRAIVTADADVVPDDPLHYRVAFIESFRHWRIYPEGLESLSSESLIFPPIDLSTRGTTDGPKPTNGPEPGADPATGTARPGPDGTPNLGNPPSQSQEPGNIQSVEDSEGPLKPVFTLLRKFAGQQSVTSDREELFDRNEQASDSLRDAIAQIVAPGLATEVTLALGLDPHLTFEIMRLRFSHKTSPAGSPRPRVLVSICQEDGVDTAGLPIRWGVTLIIDLTTNKVLYRIPKLRKDTDRPSRHSIQINSIGFSPLALEEPFMLLHQS
jgi:hypothetical protein